MALLDVYKVGSTTENTVTLSNAEARSNDISLLYFNFGGIIPSTLKLVSSVSWCTGIFKISTSSSTSGQGTIAITVEKNTSDERIATITMSATATGTTGAEITGIGYITQPAGEGGGAYEATFVLDKTEATITSDAQNGYISYTGKNIGIINASCDSDWCTVEVNSSKQIIYTVTQNTGGTTTDLDGEISGGLLTASSADDAVNGSERTANITIYANDNVRGTLIAITTFTLTQEDDTAGRIIITPSRLNIDYTAWSGTVDVEWSNIKSFGTITFVPDIGTEWNVIGYDKISGSSGSKTLTVTATENSDAGSGGEYTSRELIAQVNYTDNDDNSKIAGFVITQARSPRIFEFPIWRDTDIEIDCDNYIDYKIVYNDSMIYSGRAYSFDGTATLRVNEIMRDYVVPYMNFTLDGVVNNMDYIEATLYVSYDDWATEGETYGLLRPYYDWSYDIDADRQDLNDLIVKEVDSRQILTISQFNSKSDSSYIVRVNGNSYTIDNEMATIVFPVEGLTKPFIIHTPDAATYAIPIVCSNRGYCLYYLNRFGGYDWLLLKGKVQKSTTLTLSSYKKKINNYTQNDKRQTIQYQKDLTEKWSLNTGILNDEQSEKFAMHVIPSTQCWLHDLENNKIYPVNITDTSVTELKYRYNKKPVYYTFTAELAQDRMVR